MSRPELESEDLAYFCKMIEDMAGIHMKPAKHELVRTRLRSRIEAHGLKNFREYKKLISALQVGDPEWEIFTNQLTTNKTDFFREPRHFEFLVDRILPQWLDCSHEQTFRVWSAACSTGEEPYTLAMILSRHLPADRSFEILATDIDTDVLKSAKNAVYPIQKKIEVPADYQDCIQTGQSTANGWFRIRPEFKGKVIFQQHNLLDKTLPTDQTFDLVLCRNVLIYFAPETIDFVQRKIHRCVKPGGNLMIGHSESLQGMKHSWKIVGPSVFLR